MHKQEAVLEYDRPILPECVPRKCDGCGAEMVFGTELSCGHIFCCRVYYVHDIYDPKIIDSNVCGTHTIGNDHHFVYYDCPKRKNTAAVSREGCWGRLDVCNAVLPSGETCGEVTPRRYGNHWRPEGDWPYERWTLAQGMLSTSLNLRNALFYATQDCPDDGVLHLPQGPLKLRPVTSDWKAMSQGNLRF